MPFEQMSGQVSSSRWSRMWTRLRVNGLNGRGAAALENLRAFLGDQAGASMIVIGLTLPALIGAMGLAVEVSFWHLHKRDMQNAADAAVIAAATSNGPAYAAEGSAVASQ